jgi:hypothetical protein
MLFPMVEGLGRRITWSFSTFDVLFVHTHCEFFFFFFLFGRGRKN